MAVSEAQKRAQKKYDKEHIRYVSMKLNKVIDADILDWLAQQPSTQGSIKRLIREQIKRETDIDHEE